jgi:hypothetical protein
VNVVLAVVIVLLTVVAWVSAAILVHASRRRPRVGALTERATVAVVVAIFGTVYSATVTNAEVGGWFDIPTMVLIIRCAVILLLLMPVWWVYLYATRRLGSR